MDRRSLLFTLISLIAGAALPFAFAPFHYYFLAIISLAILFFIWQRCTAKQAFIFGLFFGLGFFGVGISWVYVSIHVYGKTPVYLAAIFTFLFVLVLASFTAVNGYLANKFFPKASWTRLLCVYPASWALFEWIKTWIFTGFPWLFLSASQVPSPLGSLSPIIGNYGVSFFVALSSSLFIGLFCKKRDPVLACLFAIMILWSGAALLNKLHWTKPTGKPVTVSLVQGDVSQQAKWERQHLPDILQRYQNLTEKNWHSDIIIWPEAAIPLLLRDADSYVENINLQATVNHASVIIGVPIQQNKKYYNALITVGDGKGEYAKRHLVPFGEYVPFAKYLRGIINFFNLPMSEFSPGPKHQNPILAKGIHIAPFICYEVAYPALVLSSAKKAQLLITISDDSWFGRSIAPAQHLQIAQERALETGRYMLFVGNSGITAIINSKGKVIRRIPEFKIAVLKGEATAMQGNTPIMRLGNLPVIIFLWLMLGVAWLVGRRSNSK